MEHFLLKVQFHPGFPICRLPNTDHGSVLRMRQASDGRISVRLPTAGCGAGHLTWEMALEVGSGGRVIGVDNNPEMLAHARSRCADLRQVELLEGEVTNLPVADGSCDAAACVQVLLHVEDVAGAIRELYRAVRRGGRIAVLETDWRSLVLSSSDQVTTQRIFDAWDAAVASPNLPVRLGPMLRQQGFSPVRAEAIPVLDASYSDGSFSVNCLEGFAQVARERGAISDAEGAAWLEDLERQGQQGRYFFCVNRFLFSATRS